LNRGTEDNSYSAGILGEKNNIALAKQKERTLKKTLGTELRRRTLLHPPADSECKTASLLCKARSRRQTRKEKTRKLLKHIPKSSRKSGGGYGKPIVRGQTEGVREIEKRKRAKSSEQEEKSAKFKSLCTATQRRQIA
jgi:hypothetical protein